MAVETRDQRRTDLAYSMTNWLLALGTTPSFFIAAYLNHATGASLAILGLISTIARVWDTLINPIIGVASDATRSRFGRRKPWVFAGVVGEALILVIGVIALSGRTITHFSAFWFAFGLMALLTLWTVAYAPYSAHSGEITKDFDRRSRMAAQQSAIGIFASLVTYGLPYLLVDPDMAWLRRGVAGLLPNLSLLDGVKAFLVSTALTGVANYGRVMTVLAIITVISTPILTWRYMRYVPELPIPPEEKAERKERGRVGDLLLPFRNQMFLVFSAGFLVFIAGYIGRLSLYPFIVPYATGGGYSFLLLMMFQCASGLLAAPLWSRLFIVMERSQIMMLACVIEAVGLVSLGLSNHGMPYLTVVGALLIGLPGGTVMMVPNMMASEAADYSRFKHGGDTRGLHTSIIGLIHKVGSFLATMGLGVAGMLGFDPHRGVTAHDVVNITWLGLYGPAILILLGGLIMMAFPITRARHRAIQIRVDRRAALILAGQAELLE